MRFCEYCGAPLEDGQVCTCPQAQHKQQEQTTPQPEQPSQPAQQPQPEQPNQQPPQSSQQGYSYGQAQGSQPGPGNPQSGYEYQQPGYGYQQQSGYGYQKQPGYGYQQQGYGYQPGQPGGPSTQQAQQFSQMGKQVRDTTVHAAKSLKPFVAQYWASPVQAVRTAVAEKNLTLAVTLTVIRVVVVIALLWSMVGQVAGILRGSLGALNALSSMFGSSTAMTVSGNPLGSLVFGLLLAVLGMALFTLVLFVLTCVFKSGGSILDAYIANSANGGATTLVLLLAFVCSFFSLNLALGMVALACFTAVLFGGLSAQALCQDQSSGGFWMCYLIGVAVILLVSWWLVPALVYQAVGGITLSMKGESITIRQILDQLEDGGLTNILSRLFGQMLY